jgi:flotillin
MKNNQEPPANLREKANRDEYPAMKKFGYVVTNPAEFAIHQRRGKTKHQGRGISFFVLPVIDRYYLIPSTTHTITFVADQITAENQGVEVSGFAIWKITEPERASLSFDFSDAGSAVGRISESMKEVVESAIRHQVAKMTIEDVLRKRGSIILQLKEELAYIAEQWGLTIETIEIKTVRIMSEQLFTNMQAKFRDTVRLESETSGSETEKEIARRRYTQREELALVEQEFQRRDLQRKAEIETLNAQSETALRVLKMGEDKRLKIQESVDKAELLVIEQANRERALRLEDELLSVERAVQTRRFAFEAEQRKHRVKLGTLDDDLVRRRTETANMENATLALVKNLHLAVSGLKVNELNLGDDAMRQMINSLSGLIARGRA